MGTVKRKLTLVNVVDRNGRVRSVFVHAQYTLERFGSYKRTEYAVVSTKLGNLIDKADNPKPCTSVLRHCPRPDRKY